MRASLITVLVTNSAVFSRKFIYFSLYLSSSLKVYTLQCHFRLRLWPNIMTIPFSHCSPYVPAGHTQRYFLGVNPLRQVPL